MAFEAKPNTGSVFQNDRKERDEHPDRTGQGNIECPHCGKTWDTWINGWLRKTRDGKPFLSLSFKPKQKPQQQQTKRNEYAEAKGGGGGSRQQWDEKLGGDDVPF